MFRDQFLPPVNSDFGMTLFLLKREDTQRTLYSLDGLWYSLGGLWCFSTDQTYRVGRGEA
jgi:hypothetical protein